jgi:hypothetical protein
MYIEHHELTNVAKNLKIKSSCEGDQWNCFATNPIMFAFVWWSVKNGWRSDLTIEIVHTFMETTI